MSLDRRRLALLAAGGTLAAAAPRWLGAGETPRPGEVVTGDDLPAREASWYKKLDRSRVECQLCPQGCVVADMERGSCGVRENRGGTYYTLVHSLACSLHTDPIEKKPFFHVLPGELALSFAHRRLQRRVQVLPELGDLAVPAGAGPVLLAAAGVARRDGEALRASKLTAATYSEPVVFWEYVRDVATAARKAGLRPTIVSNGFIQEQPLREVLPAARRRQGRPQGLH